LPNSTLYADDTPATAEAVRILDGRGVIFSVRFWHAMPRTPALRTPFGMFLGVEGVRSFAESFDPHSDAPAQRFDQR
jgi:hypothetical protein